MTAASDGAVSEARDRSNQEIVLRAAEARAGKAQLIVTGRASYSQRELMELVTGLAVDVMALVATVRRDSEGVETNEVQIVVNERTFAWNSAKPLSHPDCVALAGGTHSPNATVTFHTKGHSGGGIIAPAQSIAVKPGLIVNVADTGNA